MAINSWIGIANGIGFKNRTKGGDVPPEEFCSLAYDDTTLILLDNGDSIAVECNKPVEYLWLFANAMAVLFSNNNQIKYK